MIQAAVSRGCPLIFLIASRPEPRLCIHFYDKAVEPQLLRVRIEDDLNTRRDLTLYFHTRFNQLRDTHGHVLAHVEVAWPDEDVINKLVERACGQFIFAATVMAYLESDDALPQKRLEEILHIDTEDLPNSPYAALDLLYCQILSSCGEWEKVREILTLLVTAHSAEPHGNPHPGLLHETIPRLRNFSWRSPEGITRLLKLDRGEVQVLLFRLHAVMEVPGDADVDIRILHASFIEFLSDPHRSKKYHVNRLSEPEFLDYVVCALLYTCSSFKYTFSDTAVKFFKDSHLESFERFSVEHCLLLCQRSARSTKQLMDALNDFDPWCVATFSIQIGLGTSRVQMLFCSWKDTLIWAKGLSEHQPIAFISMMEMFMGGFYVILPPGSSLHTIAHLEHAVFATEASWKLLTRVFPASSVDPSMSVSSSLFIVRDSQTSVSKDCRIEIVRDEWVKSFNDLVQFFDCSDDLVSDICDDTRRSVSVFHLLQMSNLMCQKFRPLSCGWQELFLFLSGAV
ncbi:hypothetical protein VNI00_017474 [Paramarasmius palmivorus]|uniref:Uncharacterized protein n=1 Tax=Paramarasmius palmivorus TaxID=297713 RepID=A0AAW0B5D0_9AGAR